MKTKRIATVLLAGVLAVAAVAAFTACGDSTGTSGSDTYVMEAEYIDLDDVSGAGISSDQSGVDMIYGDGTEAQKELGWSNGYFVGYTYSSGLELNFVFDSDKDATATVILRLGSELGDINLDPTNFSVILNGTEITYSSMYVENSSIDSMKFTDKTVTSSASVKKGENTLTLKVLSNTLMNGTKTGGPCVDCVKLQTSAKLTWTDKTDNPDRRGSIGELE
ncbi:MAG TPA: hypothetical protein H9692_03835 [Firmicutes bacterium]|nr:hypothetical protein [Bacillota bacterium]